MVKNIRNIFGDFVREKRTALGLSQAQLAEAAKIEDPHCKMTKQRICAIEAGKVNLTLDKQQQLLDAMGADINFTEN